MKINTVNVIEMNHGDITSLRSFDQTPEGIREADEYFSKLAIDKQAEYQNKGEENWAWAAMHLLLKDGIWEDGNGYEVVLIHSI